MASKILVSTVSGNGLLPKWMLAHCQLESHEQKYAKLESNYKSFRLINKMSGNFSAEWQPCCSGLNVLKCLNHVWRCKGDWWCWWWGKEETRRPCLKCVFISNYSGSTQTIHRMVYKHHHRHWDICTEIIYIYVYKLKTKSLLTQNSEWNTSTSLRYW